MFHIGTSGYSYDDWVGPFYPPTLDKADRLQFYARHFNTTEINSTFYRILPPSAMAAMARKTPDGFIFTVKLNRAMTHEFGPDTDAAFGKFRESLKPIIERGQLGCILAQFAYSFHNNEVNRQYLARMADRLQGLPTVVEFRNDEWLREPVYAFLRQHGLGFVCVDQPRLKGLIPPLAIATSEIGYLRLHGRNAAKWWHHDEAYERYDYLYGEDELKEWVPRLKRLASETRDTFVFFNNHYMAQAATNAKQLIAMLDE